jgi:hypothetical protein
MNLPGETKAGNAAMQPMPRGKPGGLIETMNGAQRLPFCAPQEDHIGSEDPDALKIAARRAEYSLTESALSPFQAEPTQLNGLLRAVGIGEEHHGPDIGRTDLVARSGTVGCGSEA